MIFYQAAVFDRSEQLGEPEKEVGHYTTLQAAQANAIDAVTYIDEEPLVNVYEAQGEEYQCIGIWWEDRSGPAPAWKYRAEE